MAMSGGTAKLVYSATPTGWSDPVELYVYYKHSPNNSANTSTITVGMYVKTPDKWDIGPWSDYYGSYVGTSSLTFNGGIDNFYGTRWLVENKTYTVNHNPDGSGTATISWKWGVSSSWANYNSPSGSFTITLTKIPRAATLTTAPNFNDEENPTITYNNSAGNSVSSLQACISLDGSTDDIAYRDISKTGSSYTFNLTDAERAVLRNATTTSTSRTVRFFVRTIIGTQTFHSILTKTLTIVNATPAISAIFYDNNATTAALTGSSSTTVVKGYSNVIYEIQATAKKGASIKSYSASCGDKKATTASGTFTAVNSGSLNFSTTDSRGLTASKSANMILINYNKPTIGVEAKIEMDGATTARIELAVKGTFFNATFGAVKNTLDIQIKHTGSNDWVSMNALGFEASYNGNNYSLTFGVSELEYTTAFTYQVRVIDKLETIYGAEETLRVNPVFDWGKDDFNFNVPISMNNNQVLRHTEAGATVLSAESGNLYLRPNGNDVDEGQLRIFSDGKATLNGAQIMTVDNIYPVGAIYISYNHTSPASLFGGTWTRIENRFLWAVDGKGNIGYMGGESTHTLTINEMPSHAHYLYNENSNSSESANYEIIYKPTAKGYAGTLKTQPAGGGAAHNNMPPYIQVSMWRRTA